MIILKIVRRALRMVVVFFFASTILAVVAYRFIPVYFTPLMFIRSAQQISRGDDFKMHHTWVGINEMSRYMPVAVIASEDQRFMEHHGFDFEAISKAVERNKTSKKKYGASTISQQTAKNVFLWPGRTWVRKGLEVYFTFLIETMWSKERIIEVYLNSIEMGDGIYGVAAVAEQHFNTTAIDLKRDQCALIAATLPNPIRFNSAKPSNYMFKRQRQIMRQMTFIPLLSEYKNKK